ncbi:hypothetical protein GCM10025780_08700 [Frondihabitans cladoniiphilus]|uniref:Uncharacterized protein n=1 Tax=Frondihabitans cladoniiphilus TaxID=715785 RepID=A0ABP8VRK8_9MICO
MGVGDGVGVADAAGAELGVTVVVSVTAAGGALALHDPWHAVSENRPAVARAAANKVVEREDFIVGCPSGGGVIRVVEP